MTRVAYGWREHHTGWAATRLGAAAAAWYLQSVADSQTVDDRDDDMGAGAPPRQPGVVLIFGAGEPQLVATPLDDVRLVLGRPLLEALGLPDGRTSRQHAEVCWARDRWVVRDLGSRNGTFLDGQPVSGQAGAQGEPVLRIGHSVFLLLADVTGFPTVSSGLAREGAFLAGPRLRPAIDAIRRAAASGDTLLITGESGTGKELAARLFHDAGPSPKSAFVAVNCAAIPEGVAERVLFGAKKGAYSGAGEDADGYAQAADGGTLFLDELGELELKVQAKLLRLIEAREVQPVGAGKPRRLALRVCAATNRDLALEVDARSFRGDLFYRIARPEVRLPPLRARLEELPWLAAHAVRDLPAQRPFHARAIEALLVRPWPGNVRELLTECREAARAALEADASTIGLAHLPPRAAAAATAPAAAGVASALDRDALVKALDEAGGNVSAAARALGLHRTQLYRLLKREGLDR